MPYADTDFFLALLKPSDWLKKSAKKLLKRHGSELWTSPATLVELLWLAKRKGLDATRLLLDVLKLAELQGGDSNVFLRAAEYVSQDGVEALDALHAAYCGSDKIISSDTVFDQLGLERIRLAA